jgi:transposase
MPDGETQGAQDRELDESRRENSKLKGRIAELERKLEEALKKLDEALRAKRRQAAPFSKGDPVADPKRRGRKPGPSYGLKAHRPVPDHVDEVIPVPLPDHCPCGGGTVLDQTFPQYQEEIPQKPIIRRFDVAVGHCRNCGRHVQGRHPLQTSDALGAAAAQLGPNAQAMTALLKDKVGVSYGDVGMIFRDFFGIALSRGGAAQMVLRVADRAKAAYRGIEIVVRRSRVVYPDETGWKVGGWLQWMWVFVTRTATLFKIRDSRGHDVPEEVLGADWSGDMVHDGWMPYDFFEEADHQQCVGHIQRRCRSILEWATRGAVRFPRAVLDLFGAAFGLRRRRDAEDISRHGLAVAIGRLEARLERLLGWHLSNPTNVKLANHLGRHRDELFLFLKKPWLEATSWPADHAIRPAVANRKVFGGNRDPKGAAAQEILASIAATCVQRNTPAFDFLSRVIRATPGRRDALACRLLNLPHQA